jgi:hypothetical protein
VSVAAALLLTSMVGVVAAPPPAEGPEPPSVTDPAEGPAEDPDAGEAGEDPAEPSEAAPSASPPKTGPTPMPGPVDPAAGLPRDERNDPILPYGETDETTGVEYADETPPPPELEYADETPPPPELPYDQTRQRTPPTDEALERESDLEDGITEDQFQHRQESPQRFAMEVKFGPYLPDVDRNYEGAGFGPYATIYGRTDDQGVTTGQPRKGVYSVVSFEWQFINLAGPLSIGTQIGYFRDSANALIDEPVTDGESVRSSADKTNFNVIPIAVLLGYRFELLADRYKVPLVPYARGGVAYGFWVEKKGGELATNDAGRQSRGGSWGWQANLGLMLRLDFIERASAVDLDRLSGINHTYLFAEWQFSRLNNFGAGSAMSIGDDTFLVGLAIEF